MQPRRLRVFFFLAVSPLVRLLHGTYTLKVETSSFTLQAATLNVTSFIVPFKAGGRSD